MSKGILWSKTHIVECSDANEALCVCVCYHGRHKRWIEATKCVAAILFALQNGDPPIFAYRRNTAAHHTLCLALQTLSHAAVSILPPQEFSGVISLPLLMHR